MKPLDKVKWMAAAAKSPELSDSCVRVAVYLCNCENGQTGQCNPAIEWISQDTGVSRSSVKRAISALVKAGLIGVASKGNGRGNRTDYVLIKGFTNAPLYTEQRGSELTPFENVKGSKTDTQRGSPVSLKGFKTVIPPCTPLLGEPVKEPVKEPVNVSDGVKKTHPVAPAKKSAEEPKPTTETWTAYAAAYERRYGVQPVRNATVSGQLANFVKRIGKTESPAVAAHYVDSNNGFYVRNGHAVGLMVKDAEKLRTEWATGRQVTQTQAAQVDRTQSNYNSAQEALRILEAKGAHRG